MATDIAFTLAILKTLGNRLPLSIKIFLTAFAIVDDLAAVLVIALFYSSDIDWMLILYSAIPLGILFIMTSRGLYYKYFSVVVAIIVWFLFLKSGIHPTIAVVLMAFTIPITHKVNIESFTDSLTNIAKRLKESERDGLPILSEEQYQNTHELEVLTEKFNSPLQRLEQGLNGWGPILSCPFLLWRMPGRLLVPIWS